MGRECILPPFHSTDLPADASCMKVRREAFCLDFMLMSCARGKSGEMGKRRTVAILNGVIFSPSAYKILLQTEEDRLTVVVNQGLLTLSDVRIIRVIVGIFVS